MRGSARSVASRLLLLYGQASVPGATGPTFYAPLGLKNGPTTAAAVVWGASMGPERWFGSHISRQNDKNGKNDKKGSGKGKKKAGGAPGQKRKNKGSGGTGRGTLTPPSAEMAALEEGRREGKDVGTSAEASASGPVRQGSLFSYAGPFSSAVSKVKKLSLFSCFVTMSSVPIMIYLDPAALVEGAAETSMTARMSLAGSLSAFGVGTTGLLNWFVSPYVHSLTYGEGKLRVETLDFFARPRVAELALHDVDGGASDSMHPLSTFRDRRDGRVYYVDKDYLHNDELLAVLAPEEEGDQGDDKGWSD